MVRTLALAAALGIVAPTAAVAQMMSPLVHFGATGGISIPLGDFSKANQLGYVVGGLFEGTPSGFPVGLRAEVSYSGYTVKGGGFTNNLLEFLANVVINFEAPNSGPYLIGGGGLYRSTGSGLAGIGSSNNFGVNGGAGFRWPVAGASTFVEARFHVVATDSRTFINPGGSTSTTGGSARTFLPIVLGVTF